MEFVYQSGVLDGMTDEVEIPAMSAECSLPKELLSLLHFGEHEVLADIIVNPQLFSVFPALTRPSSAARNLFPVAVDRFPNASARFSIVSGTFFQALGSRNVGSVAPWNHRNTASSIPYS
jgi:hypothetical protein